MDKNSADTANGSGLGVYTVTDGFRYFPLGLGLVLVLVMVILMINALS